MIAKGNLHANGRKLAAYLTNGKDGERAELIEARGFVSEDLEEGFAVVEAIARTQTRCQKPFFHAYVRLPEGERLDHEKWLGVVDRIEEGLGFTDQPRAVAFHIAPDGEAHLHVAWSRIDAEAMCAIDPGLYKNTLKAICRELEQEFGLRELNSERDADQRTQSASRAEFEQTRRLGIDVTEVRETIRNCLDRSDDGASFVAALDEQGLMLARGDRRDFVVIDQEGGLHALSKRITSLTAEQTRARLGTEFGASLPTVEDARDAQEARRELTGSAPDQKPDLRQQRAALKSEISALWAESVTGEAFVEALAEHGYVLCQGDRRDMILLDHDGAPHALPRLIEDVRTADVRARLVNMDRTSWPTVAEACAAQALRVENFDRDAADPAWREKVDETVRSLTESTGASAGRVASDVGSASPEMAVAAPDVPTPEVAINGAARGAARILSAVGRLAESAILALDSLLTGSTTTIPVQTELPPTATEMSPPVVTPAPELLVQAQEQQELEAAIARTAQAFRDAMRDDPELDAGYLGPDTPLERTRRR